MRLQSKSWYHRNILKKNKMAVEITEFQIHMKANNAKGCVCKQFKAIRFAQDVSNVNCPKCLKTLQIRSKRKKK